MLDVSAKPPPSTYRPGRGACDGLLGAAALAVGLVLTGCSDRPPDRPAGDPAGGVGEPPAAAASGRPGVAPPASAGADVPPATAPAAVDAGRDNGSGGGGDAAAFRVERRASVRADTKWVTALAARPDGRSVAVAGSEGAVMTWDLRSDRVTALPGPPTGGAVVLAFSPDGGRLAGVRTGPKDSVVWVRDAAAGGQREVTVGGRTVQSVRFDGRGAGLLFTDPDGLWSWDGRGDPVAVCRTEDIGGMATATAAAPDGSRLASAPMLAAGGGAVRVEVRLYDDPDRGHFSRLFAADASPGRPGSRLVGFNQLLFSPDGRYLAGGGEVTSLGSVQSHVKVWEVATGQEVMSDTLEGRVMPGTTLKGFRHFGGLAFSPDGRLLAIASGDTAGVYAVAGGRPVAALECPGEDIRRVCFCDGRRLVTATTEGRLQAWELIPEAKAPAADAGGGSLRGDPLAKRPAPPPPSPPPFKKSEFGTKEVPPPKPGTRSVVVDVPGEVIKSERTGPVVRDPAGAEPKAKYVVQKELVEGFVAAGYWPKTGDAPDLVAKERYNAALESIYNARDLYVSMGQYPKTAREGLRFYAPVYSVVYKDPAGKEWYAVVQCYSHSSFPGVADLDEIVKWFPPPGTKPAAGGK